MKTKHRAILKNQQDEKPAVKQVCNSCWGRGAVKENDPMCDRQNESLVTCKPCKGTGYVGALVALLLLVLCNADAATVTGTVRNRQGAAVSTNILFKAIQRPLFDFEPSVRPGWTVTTNSASDGTFATVLLAGNYQVTVGGENRDSWLIEVPTNSGTYEITALSTNAANYIYTGTRELTNFLESLNGSTHPTQLLATDTNNSDFTITSSATTHTFSLPPASATKSGKLTSADWADFYSRVTQAQITAASNALVTYSMALSNTLHTAETTRNAAVSNASVAFAMSVSNDVYSVETTRNAAVSNAAVSFAMTVSNSVYALETTRNAAVSNGAVSFSMTTSNDVYTAETTRNAAVSNAAVAFAMTMSNTVYGLETTRHLAVSNAAVAFTMSASNTLYRTGTNLTTEASTRFGLWVQTTAAGRLEFYGLEQGTNTILYFNGSNIVINAVAATSGGGSDGLLLQDGGGFLLQDGGQLIF